MKTISVQEARQQYGFHYEIQDFSIVEKLGAVIDQSYQFPTIWDTKMKMAEGKNTQYLELQATRFERVFKVWNRSIRKPLIERGWYPKSQERLEIVAKNHKRWQEIKDKLTVIRTGYQPLIPLEVSYPNGVQIPDGVELGQPIYCVSINDFEDNGIEFQKTIIDSLSLREYSGQEISIVAHFTAFQRNYFTFTYTKDIKDLNEHLHYANMYFFLDRNKAEAKINELYKRASESYSLAIRTVQGS